MVSRLASVGPLSPGRKANLARPSRRCQGVVESTIPQTPKKCRVARIRTGAPSPLHARWSGFTYSAPMRIDEIIDVQDADLLGRVLPAEDRGGDRAAVRDRALAARAGARLRLGHLRRRRLDPRGHGRDHQGAQGRARPRDDGAPELRRRDQRGASAATLDRIAEAGIENVFALRGDPPRGEEDFVQPEGGLGSAAELAEFISAGWDFTIGGACFPEVHPEAPDLETDLAYLKTKVEAGASLPDHPALLRQPGLLRLRRRGAGGGHRRADPRRGDPGRQLRPDEADLRALRRLDPAAPRSGLRRGRRRRARPSSSSASPTPPSSARSCCSPVRPASTSTPSTGRRRRGRCSARCSAARPWERAAATTRRPAQAL